MRNRQEINEQNKDETIEKKKGEQMKFHILGEKTTIMIDVLNRSYPEFSDYWDGNWVASNLVVEIPGFFVRFNAELRTDELREFLNDLKKIHKSLKGKAVLKNMEDVVYIEGEITKQGSIMWTAEVCYPVGNGAVLNFNFESDQTFIGELIKELDDILIAFPVRGRP